MSDFYQFRPVPIGEGRSEGVVCYDAPDTPHAFTGAEVLAATLFRLSDGAALASPAVAITPGVTGGLTITFDAASTVAAGVPGTYGCNVTYDGKPAVNGRIYLAPAPGYPPPGPDASAFATDEDIALRVRGDYALLTEDDPTLAAGSAGAFAAGDRWTLADAAADFAGQGVRPGHVALLWGEPGTAFAAAWPRATEDAPLLYVAEAVGTTTLGLRVLGGPAGAGQAPGPAAGADGVSYRIPTVAAKLAYHAVSALRDVRQAGASDAVTADDLARMVAITTLRDLYIDAARRAKDDVLLTKAALYRDEWAAELASVTARRTGGVKVGPMAFADPNPPALPAGYSTWP